MFGTEERESGSTRTAPSPSSSTPASSRPMPAVLGFLPVADITASASTPAAVAQPGAEARRGARSLDRRVEAEVDAALAHLGGERGAQIVVEAAQEERTAIHQWMTSAPSP